MTGRPPGRHSGDRLLAGLGKGLYARIRLPADPPPVRTSVAAETHSERGHVQFRAQNLAPAAILADGPDSVRQVSATRVR